MKKRFILLIVMISTFLFNSRVSALCVDKNIDTKDMDFYYDYTNYTGPAVTFFTTSLPDNVRVVVTDENGEVVLDDYSQNYVNNIIDLPYEDIDEFESSEDFSGLNYTITIYSETCKDEPFYKKTISEDHFNNYYLSQECSLYSYLSACQPFTDTSNIESTEELEEEIQKEIKLIEKQEKEKVKEEEKAKQKETFLNSIQSNYMYFAIPFVVILSAVVIVIVVAKRKEVKKDEED